MEGLLGDGDGDVSRRDVSPRDVSLYRAGARGAASRSLLRARHFCRQEEKQKASSGPQTVEIFLKNFLKT